MKEQRDTLPTERVGLVVYALMINRGQKLTTAQLAAMVELKEHGIWAMLSKLSRVLPIMQDVDGWYIEKV